MSAEMEMVMSKIKLVAPTSAMDCGEGAGEGWEPSLSGLSSRVSESRSLTRRDSLSWGRDLVSRSAGGASYLYQ